MNDRQRLEAVVDVVRSYLPPDGISREEAMSQIIALVDPLPAQPEQEPVLWKWSGDGWSYEKPIFPATPLYTAPPSKPFVFLTKEDMPSGDHPMYDTKEFYAGMAWAQTKLKEKNT